MCGPAALPVVSTLVSVVSAVQKFAAGRKADKRAKEANAQAKESSEKALKQQERDMNRRNSKKPNVAAILAGNQQATQNTTLLTGPGGVDPNSLNLGKNTLLGQ